MAKYIATIIGLGLAVAFVAIFFVGRTETKHLSEVAPRVGMSYDELMALGPRIATSTGVTLGTSRHVVYLLACSGKSEQGDAGSARLRRPVRSRRQKRLSDREAVGAVLATVSSGASAATPQGLLRAQRLAPRRTSADAGAVLAGALGFVEALVGALQRVFDALAGAVTVTPAEKVTNTCLLLVHEEAAGQRALQSRQDLLGVECRRGGQQAPRTPRRRSARTMVGRAQRLADDGGQRFQGFVADAVAELVVQALEVVDVEQADRERGLLSARSGRVRPRRPASGRGGSRSASAGRSRPRPTGAASRPRAR